MLQRVNGYFGETPVIQRGYRNSHAAQNAALTLVKTADRQTYDSWGRDLYSYNLPTAGM